MQRREFITVLGGAAVTWPLAAGSQPGVKPVIGILGGGSAEGYAKEVAAFRAGLAEAGFIEHQNVVLEYRWADDHLDRLPGLAAELVRLKVSVIVSAGGTGTALVAKAATITIPIVFSLGGDPVKAGLVASLSRPGGNITGVAAFSDLLIIKRLELAHGLVRSDAAIAFLINTNNPNKEMRQSDIHDAASAIGRDVRVLFVSSPEEFDAVFTMLAKEKVGAVIPGDEALFNNNSHELVAIAARHAIPVIYQYRQFIVEGGLMSYGPKLEDNYHQLGIYASRILKGDRPADLPVVRPSRFYLVINLATARSIGLDIPPALLARADEVIE